MRQITVEAFEDESRPQGGHAVILLHGLDGVDARPTFRLKPVDATGSSDARALRGRAMAPLATRKTHQGVELLVGPEVVANPQLLSGTPVIIELPEVGVRGEFLWPNVRPLLQSRRRHVVVTKKTRRALLEPSPRERAGQDAKAGGGIASLDTEALLRLLGESAGEPIRVDDAPPSQELPVGGSEQVEESFARLAEAIAEAPASDDLARETDLAVTAAAGQSASDTAGSTTVAAEEVQAAIPPTEHATEMKWTGERDARRTAASWAGPMVVALVALVGAGIYAIATRSNGRVAPPQMEATVAVPEGKSAAALEGSSSGGTGAQRAKATGVAARPTAASGDGAAPSGGSGGAGSGESDRGGGRTSAAAVAVPGAIKSAEPCGEASISTEAMSGGRMAIAIRSACRAGQPVTIAYGGADIVKTLDKEGRLDWVLDCFAGSETPTEVRFTDGGRRSVAITTKDLERVSKVAVLWKAPVDLDLNAFEYAAQPGERGHVSAANPSSAESVEKEVQGGHRGRGFLSVTDRPQGAGDRIEVYTFVHAVGQSSGLVPLALDYASRGGVANEPMCGKGALAEIPFRVVTRLRNGEISRQTGLIASAACGARIDAAARFNTSILPPLSLRN